MILKADSSYCYKDNDSTANVLKSPQHNIQPNQNEIRTTLNIRLLNGCSLIMKNDNVRTLIQQNLALLYKNMR